jgi:uncharacterized protein involved in exopolysaccharide biosynthesis
VTVWTLVQQPIYQAVTTVLIEPEPPKVLNIQDVTPIGAQDVTGSAPSYYMTQYEIIKSRAVFEKVAAARNLKGRFPSLRSAAEPSWSMLGSLSVEPKRNTRLVQIKFAHPDPALAAEIANAAGEAYARYNLDLKARGALDAVAWLTEQMRELKGKVQDSADALQNYRVKAGIIGIEEQRKITAQKIIDFNRAYLEAQAQRLSIEAKLNELNRIAKDRSGAQTIFIVADNPLIQRLKAEGSELEVQRSKLLKTYKDKHPEVLKVDAQLQHVAEKIDNEIKTMLRAVQTEYRVARAREETLLGNVNQLRRDGQDLNEKEIQYLALQRENEANQQLYDAMLKRLKETSVSSGLEANNVQVIERAGVPLVPIKPRRMLNLAVGVLLGLFAGVTTAFALEYFDTSLRTNADVELKLGLPVIGIVPLFEGKR